MANDALDPGDGSYPYFPRRPDGSPAWSDVAGTDGIAVPGQGPGGLVTPMPRGSRRHKGIVIDVTPTAPGGAAIAPPVRMGGG